ncbi:MAG: elongation factor Ts [Gammaproteobacteria bacterium]|nr:elongation factor Ts [Gammaproteobacteria bacterium]
MIVSADQVKLLRERSGSGMMECKKALVEANGDIDTAFEYLRKKGSAQADKKASNIAAEGRMIIKISPDYKHAAMVEINSQTDFVAKDDSFKEFAEGVAMCALAAGVSDVSAIAELKFNDSETIEEKRRSLVGRLGENIQIRRAHIMHSEGTIGSYLHSDRIGVLVQLSTDNKELGKDLAMHIAASCPRAISPSDIPQSVIEKEREIFTAQAQASGKPNDIIEKMVEGRIKKFTSEECLLGQPFVKDPSRTIDALLTSENAKVLSFVRFEVGEGIEKKVENFADEVMAQVRGSK